MHPCAICYVISYPDAILDEASSLRSPASPRPLAALLVSGCQQWRGSHQPCWTTFSRSWSLLRRLRGHGHRPASRCGTSSCGTSMWAQPTASTRSSSTRSLSKTWPFFRQSPGRPAGGTDTGDCSAWAIGAFSSSRCGTTATPTTCTSSPGRQPTRLTSGIGGHPAAPARCGRVPCTSGPTVVHQRLLHGVGRHTVGRLHALLHSRSRPTFLLHWQTEYLDTVPLQAHRPTETTEIGPAKRNRITSGCMIQTPAELASGTLA